MYLDRDQNAQYIGQPTPSEEQLLGIVYDEDYVSKKLERLLAFCRLDYDIKCLPCMDRGPLTLEYFLGLRPDFLIIDLDAAGDDGPTFGHLIRNYLDYEIPIIFTSTNWEGFTRCPTLHQKNTFFLIKPYPPQKLRELFKTLFS